MQNIDITQIVIALIGVLSAIITGWLIPLLKSKTTAAQWGTITVWAKTGVQAAEVLVKGEKKGPVKKQIVADYIENQCKEHNITIDTDSVEYAIENAWADMTGGTNEKAEDAG